MDGTARYCSHCGKPLTPGDRYCGECGFPVTDYQPVEPVVKGRAQTENNSGQGKDCEIPPEIKGWNWGAFFLNWIWGLGNRTYLALLTLVPLVNLVMPFILGGKGSEWAWRNKRWDSVEHFKKVQKTWARWGFGLFLFGMACAVLAVVLDFGF